MSQQDCVKIILAIAVVLAVAMGDTGAIPDFV